MNPTINEAAKLAPPPTPERIFQTLTAYQQTATSLPPSPKATTPRPNSRRAPGLPNAACEYFATI
jgi:hypothetical protein